MAGTTVPISVPPRHSLRLEDLPQKFPEEVRVTIYTKYFQPPENSFVCPDLDDRLKNVVSLRSTYPILYEEIMSVLVRIPSKPEFISLSSKNANRDGFEGFPKQILQTTDWLNLRYLVLTVKFFDISERNAVDATEAVRISIPKESGAAFLRVRDLQKNNPYLGQLSRVRYDLEYDETHMTERENFSLPISDLVIMFPLAKSVWAEPIGTLANGRALEIIRSFNFSRRVSEYCSPSKRVLNLVTGMSERRKLWRPTTSFTFADEFAERLSKAKRVIRAVNRSDWTVRSGVNFEIYCKGCDAKFRSHRPVTVFPEEAMLARQQFTRHCLRSTENHGIVAPCPYRPRGRIDL